MKFIDKFIDICKTLINFYINIWLFRKNLASYLSNDFTFNLLLFKRSLELTKNNMIQSLDYEYNKSSFEKIIKAIFLIDIVCEEKILEEVISMKMGYSLDDDIYLTKEKIYNWFKAHDEYKENAKNELFDLLKENIEEWWA